MRDGWRRSTLGELFEPSTDRVGDYVKEPVVLSVSKHKGVMPADAYFSRRVASVNLNAYKLLSQDAWVYSTIHIDEGSIARNTTGVDGVVSPMYTVMRWKSSRDDARYVESLLRSPQMLATYSDRAKGSINRRRSLSWKVFRGITIELPPVEEQRRIVDLIAAVDDSIDAADLQSSTAWISLDRVREALLRSRRSRMTPFSELVSRVRRPVDVEAERTYQEVGVRSHGKGTFLKDETTGAELGNKKVFWLTPGDLVFNIVFAWEGAIAVLGDDVDGRLASHRFPTFRGHADWAVPFLHHYFRSEAGRQALRDYSPGGAGRNRTLNLTRLGSHKIPIPSEDDCRLIVQTLDTAAATARASEALADALRELGRHGRWFARR